MGSLTDIPAKIFFKNSYMNFSMGSYDFLGYACFSVTSVTCPSQDCRYAQCGAKKACVSHNLMCLPPVSAERRRLLSESIL